MAGQWTAGARGGARKTRGRRRYGKGYGTTTRRRGRQQQARTPLDFGNLKISSLRRYLEMFNIDDVPLCSSREDLSKAALQHFFSQVVEEEDVIFNLAKKRWLETSGN